jgi:hypothetical protein
MNGFAFAEVPPEELALASSLFYLLRQLGGSVGVALCATLVEARGDRGAALAFALVAITAPLSLWPMRRARQAQAAGSP